MATHAGSPDVITFTCSACGHSADFPKAQEGKAIYCPKCQAAQVVKAPGGGTDRIVAERIPTGRIVKAETGPDSDRIARPQSMAGSGRIDFACGACGHTSRISAALSGQPVRCPTCGTVQLAGVSGLRVVRLDQQGKLPFTCTACNFQVRLSPDYGGKAIRCPKCQAAQVVPRVLRDGSGAQAALAAAAPVVGSQPGTGSHAKGQPPPRQDPVSGVHARKPAVAPAPLPPAASLPVARPPTPSPERAATPPPGPVRTPEPGSIRTPLPSQGITLTRRAQPSPPADEAELDFDGDAEAPGETRARGSVVRRSGRMQAPQRTPQPDTEPTLEAAHAVRADVGNDLPEGHARARSGGRPLWPVVGLAGLGVLLLGVVILLGYLLNAATAREGGLQQQLAAERKRAEAANAVVAELQQKVVEAQASRQLISTDRDELRSTLEALRHEHERLKASNERLKAEAESAARTSAPAGGAPAGK